MRTVIVQKWIVCEVALVCFTVSRSSRTLTEESRSTAAARVGQLATDVFRKTVLSQKRNRVEWFHPAEHGVYRVTSERTLVLSRMDVTSAIC